VGDAALRSLLPFASPIRQTITAPSTRWGVRPAATPAPKRSVGGRRPKAAAGRRPRRHSWRS